MKSSLEESEDEEQIISSATMKPSGWSNEKLVKWIALNFHRNYENEIIHIIEQSGLNGYDLIMSN